jgi:hypothetical protein
MEAFLRENIGLSDDQIAAIHSGQPVVVQSHDAGVPKDKGALANWDLLAEIMREAENQGDSSIGPALIPAEVWTYALAKLKLTVTDVGSGKPVWTARASEKIPYPKNGLKDLRTRVDDLVAKTLKSFPPASKPKLVHSDEAFSRTSRIREETVAP